jgi:four helix bundle protein
MKINKFEDILAWKKSRELLKKVYDITKNTDFKRDYNLKSQILRAGISLMSNIAEGFSRRTNKEFVQYLFIAKGSLAEIQSQLYIALDQNYINRNEFKDVYSHCEEIAKQISGFIKYLKSTIK